MPEFGGKIKCIYIDPPYNTGNENWAYNDNVNDPKIKKWLNKVVGSDDLSRHDKWLCMMYPRLRLLHELLSKDGVIFISIDDNEIANLKLLCDEIFGERNFVANLIWQKKKGGSQDSENFAKEHEYIVCYKKSDWQIFDITQEHDIKDFSKIINGKNAKLMKLEKWGAGALQTDAPSLYYPIKDPNGNDFYPIAPNGQNGRWRKKPENLDKEHIFWQKNSKGRLTPYEVIYFDEMITEKVIKTRTIFTDYGTTTDATKEIQEIFGYKIFDTPKPSNLLKQLFLLATDKNSIILDSFAGSGTTAHAVLELNKKDGGNRKFILIEMNDYANSTTAERIKRVIKGYGKEPNLTATGGSFEYFEIGEKLLLENGNLNEKVATEKIKEYIYFSETGQKLNSQNENYLLGIYENTAYYFIYEKDKSTSLNLEFLSNLVKAENYVIYADNHTLGENQLSKYKIKFKKIPRDIAKI